MKKLVSLFAVTALFITAGCSNKQKTKAIIDQKETSSQYFTQEDQTIDQKIHDQKEDYSIVS